jgi:hypothetical protein
VLSGITNTQAENYRIAGYVITRVILESNAKCVKRSAASPFTGATPIGGPGSLCCSGFQQLLNLLDQERQIGFGEREFRCGDAVMSGVRRDVLVMRMGGRQRRTPG